MIHLQFPYVKLLSKIVCLGYGICDFCINRSSIKHERKYSGQKWQLLWRKFFSGDVPLVVHWDSKIMADLCGKDHVDKLPIIVAGCVVCQMLKVSKITGWTGKNQATAVVQALEEWNLQERVVAMCFDTSNSNTGINAGACVETVRMLGKDLM